MRLPCHQATVYIHTDLHKLDTRVFSPVHNKFLCMYQFGWFLREALEWSNIAYLSFFAGYPTYYCLPVRFYIDIVCLQLFAVT